MKINKIFLKGYIKMGEERVVTEKGREETDPKGEEITTVKS